MAGTPDASSSFAHRATVQACPPTNFTTFPLPLSDAGPIKCGTDADCQDAGGLFLHCLGGTCSRDQCLVDADCPKDSVCACASQFGGNALHSNLCIQTACHVDSDCACGYCSPAYTGGCASISGYHCRTPADTCHVDADCPQMTNAFMFCQYVPMLGHWGCAPVSVCNG
jgi:hypothetical protein